MRRATLLGMIVLASTAYAQTAHAQTTIYGVDIRNNGFITTDTASFVGNLSVIGPQQASIFALDFDAAATTLWGIDNGTLEYGTFDLATGAFNPLGTVTGVTTGATGLTCSVDGTWYLSSYDSVSARSVLYVGDVTSGTFAMVGIMESGIVIDIAIDTAGNLYGHNITSETLISIDPTTGQSSPIGPTGQVANFAQGMDFDWSDDTLYAAIYAGGGAGVFATMDLATGMANALEDTTPTDGEFEIALQSPAPGVGTPFCFGDGSGTPCPCANDGNSGEGCANTTGAGAILSATGSASVSGDALSFQCAQLVSGRAAMLFVGLDALNNGDGVQFGDGLRCAGMSVVRLGMALPDGNGDASWGPGLAALGGWTSGDTRRFQVWYGDPAPSPCGSAFNLSNGIEVTFIP